MSYSTGDLKRFLKNKTNLTMILVICTLIMQFIIIFLLCFDTNKIIKKINHRYFNTTNSLEDIHHVNINTLNGSVRR